MLKNNPILEESSVSGIGGGLLILVGFVLIGLTIGNLLAVTIIGAFISQGFQNTASLINELISSPENIANGWYILMAFQAIVHIFSYLVPPLAYWHFIEKKTFGDFNFRSSPKVFVWILVTMLVFIFIPVNSGVVDWNASMALPDFLSGMEEWMRNKEDQLAEMTRFLTSYKSIGQLCIALFVVVLLPALGEETLFRGVLQRKLNGIWNYHAAIWVSAAIFSAIHFQFYGFFPRMLLGALFGYLYYWTGNLTIAVLAHFINNGFVLVMVYLYNIGVLEANIEEMKSMPLYTVMISLLLTSAILYVIRRESEPLGGVKAA